MKRPCGGSQEIADMMESGTCRNGFPLEAGNFGGAHHLSVPTRPEIAAAMLRRQARPW